MNAVDYLRVNKKKYPLHDEKNITSNLDTQEDITVDDVIYSNYKKNKNEILHKVSKDNTKPNKNNNKILKLYLKQQAKKINDMDF